MAALRYCLVAGGLLLILPGVSEAQKAKDTLRIAIDQPIGAVDMFQNSGPQYALIDRVVLDKLITFDVVKKAYVGQLAESWSQVDDRTIEFKLRKGVKFHDGSPFDADDVVYSFKYVTDPETKMLFKESFVGWIDRIEKIDSYTVRLVAKTPISTFMSKIWAAPPIYPKELHSKLANKADFGRSPIGTGPYKVTSLDVGKGIRLAKNPEYRWSGAESAGKIGKIEITSIPDLQTRIARMMVGDLDLIFNMDYQQAKELFGSNPQYDIHAAPTISYAYIAFDAADKSGVKVLKDRRVREAIFRAINRDSMRQAFLPPELAKQPPLDALCVKTVVACDYTTRPPAYDPAKARALLAEAGLSDGFPIEIITWGQTTPIAEAVAGDLRKVGIRATVNSMTTGAFIRMRSEGKAQIMVSQFDNGGGNPDVSSTAIFFYDGSSRDYSGDKQMQDLAVAGMQEFDPEKRQSIYAKLFDRANEQAYALPLVEFPAIVVKSKDIVVDSNTLKPEGFMLNTLGWSSN